MRASPLPLPVADVIKTASVHRLALPFRRVRAGGRLRSCTSLLAFRHCRIWHLPGTGAQLDCLDQYPMGQRMAEN